MALYCPRCGDRVPNRLLDLRSGFAPCPRCRVRFDFARRMPPRKGVRVAGPPDPEAPPPRPPKMRTDERDGCWLARWRWYDSSYNFLALFSLFWNGVMLFATFAMIAAGHFRGLWGLGLHGPVGLVIGYFTLAGFLNTTTVKLYPHGLAVRHGPLPWFGNRRLPAARVEQLYCRRSKVKVNDRFRYELHAALAGGGTVRLLGGFEDPDEPRFLERQIEARLGIQRQRVPGEYRDESATEMTRADPGG